MKRTSAKETTTVSCHPYGGQTITNAISGEPDDKNHGKTRDITKSKGPNPNPVVKQQIGITSLRCTVFPAGFERKIIEPGAM